MNLLGFQELVAVDVLDSCSQFASRSYFANVVACCVAVVGLHVARPIKISNLALTFIATRYLKIGGFTLNYRTKGCEGSYF